MSLLHLLWIVPVVFCLGFIVAGLFACAKSDDPVQEIKSVRGGRAV